MMNRKDKKPFHILFDLSRCFHENCALPTFHDGTTRVMAMYAKLLSQRPECSLQYCGTMSYEVLQGVERFLKARTILPSQPLVYYKTFLELYKIASKQSWLGSLCSFLDRWAPTIPYGALQQADVFLLPSPTHPVDQQIRKQKKVKVFVTIHDLIPLLFPEFADLEFYKKTRQIYSSFQESDFFFCVSQSTKEDLCRLYPIEPERVFVTPLAASTQTFCPEPCRATISAVLQKYGLPNAPYFLGLSRFNLNKSAIKILRCFARMMEQKKEEANLVLYGPKMMLWGSFASEAQAVLDTFLSHPLLRDHVFFTDYVDEEDLKALYSGATAFLFPSLYEGFGLPALEAMQCGTPVLTSNTSSLPEVVGDAALLVDPYDEDAISQGMLTLLHDTGLRKRLSTAGIQRASCFSWDRTIDIMVDAFQKVV